MHTCTYPYIGAERGTKSECINGTVKRERSLKGSRSREIVVAGGERNTYLVLSVDSLFKFAHICIYVCYMKTKQSYL